MLGRSWGAHWLLKLVLAGGAIGVAALLCSAVARGGLAADDRVGLFIVGGFEIVLIVLALRCLTYRANIYQGTLSIGGLFTLPRQLKLADVTSVAKHQVRGNKGSKLWRLEVRAGEAPVEIGLDYVGHADELVQAVVEGAGLVQLKDETVDGLRTIEWARPGARRDA